MVGAIPHFEFTRELGVESLHKAIDLAKRYDLPVDVHCDEIDDEQSRFLETLAMLAHRDGLGARVTASHTTAMHSYNGAYTSRLFRLLKLSGINFVANPLVNIHLQGRFDDYPKRRGITRVKELLGAGINTCFGHDDVFDPWYPLGTANMLQVLHMGLHVTQMMGYDEIDGGLDLITRNSARTLGLREYGIEVGHPANLLVLHAYREKRQLGRVPPAGAAADRLRSAQPGLRHARRDRPGTADAAVLPVGDGAIQLRRLADGVQRSDELGLPAPGQPAAVGAGAARQPGELAAPGRRGRSPRRCLAGRLAPRCVSPRCVSS